MFVWVGRTHRTSFGCHDLRGPHQGLIFCQCFWSQRSMSRADIEVWDLLTLLGLRQSLQFPSKFDGRTHRPRFNGNLDVRLWFAVVVVKPTFRNPANEPDRTGFHSALNTHEFRGACVRRELRSYPPCGIDREKVECVSS